MKLMRATGAAAVALLTTAALAACGNNTDGASDGASAGAPGVTEDSIKLGHITDLTGVWGPVGKKYLSGSQLWVDAVNANGGICDRTVELVVRDHKSNIQDAVTIYRELERDVFGMQTILGSGPILAAAPSLTKDKVLASTYAWDEMLLEGTETIFLPGATYEVASVALTEWVVKERGLQPGDSIGLVRYDGIFEGVLTGMELVAEEYGLNLVEQKVQVSDSDFTGPVRAFKRADAKLVMSAISTPHLGTFVSTASSQGLEPAILSPSPGNFDESLLAGPAKQLFEENSYFASPFTNWDNDSAGAAEVRDAFEKYGEGDPNYGLMLGYGQASIFGQILEAGCANGELTRDSVVDAFGSMDTVATNGIMTELDFSRGDGMSQSIEVGILQPDGSATTGFTEIQEPFISDLVAKSGL
ncbi:ABC transporter substrate-binding protein [Nocardioides limicola]|uniref:ABC transporter substrate-binding protein n=1 Tax=Nocardioides limicola TaxID=2803368 RepID=UPI00193AEA3C|nr:ABC transporter substrate-binding protein [Nocardioides sp. DJM-14]